jgi:hypothetical protein
MLRLKLAVVGSTAFIILSVVLYYTVFAHDGLPIGWDTPHYIGGALLVATRGPTALLSVQGPYNFLYQILEGGFLWMGISGTAVEIFFPIVLAGSITCLLAKLVLAHLGARAALFVALATPGWYAVYRLQADLHANLLALTLFLAALILISQSKSLREPRSLLGLSLIVLASLTHIESTLFLVFVTMISSTTKLRPYPFKLAIAATVAIIPGAFFYATHILQVLSSAGGSLEFSTTQPFDSWVIILGPLLPFTTIGFAWSTVRSRSWIEILAVVWGLTAIIIGLSQYISPQTVIFAQRAVILVPTPLLAGLGLYSLSQNLPKLRTLGVPWRFARIGTMVAIFTILALSWPVTTVLASSNEKVFLTSGENQQLEWVSANMKFSNTPIFMYNDVDEFAGGLAQLYDNWVSAKVGAHLSYLGLPDYLVQVEETPFSSLISRTVSGQYIQQLRSNGITTKAAILQHPIVLMGEFYRPFPLPAYTSTLFTEVSSGVFVDNSTKLETLANVTLPLYITFGSHSGTWGGTPASWAKSLNAYRVNDSVPPVVQASFQIRTQLGSAFNLGLRYWDGTGNNMTVAVDGRAIGNIAYNGTQRPATRYFPGLELSEGIHDLTITISNTPSVIRNASLDYVVLTPV